MRAYSRHRRFTVLVATLVVAAPAALLAQRAGQSVTVQYGKVTAAREVKLKSGAVPAGALVGGALGLASASGKSSGRKATNTLIGAMAGGGIAAAAKGSTQGMLYQVDAGAGVTIQVVTDQREILTGDCVAVEEADGLGPGCPCSVNGARGGSRG